MTGKYEKRVLDVCLLLHMSNLGSFHGLSDKEGSEQVLWLKHRLKYWHKSSKYSKKFDNIVKKLIKETLDETRDYNIKYFNSQGDPDVMWP